MKRSLALLALVPVLAACVCLGIGAGTPPSGMIVNPVFSNDAVLQREMQVPVWGTATAGTQVTVSFKGQNVTAIAGTDGKWRVNLAPMAAGGPDTMTVTGGGSTVTFTGVQVGEVWFYSGQSNMHYGLSGSTGGADAVATAGNYNIRHYDNNSRWLVSNSTNAGNFSAVAFYMGRQLAINLPGVAIGLMKCSVPGTPISSWTHYGGSGGGNYDSQVKPNQPYAIRGACWYQGEDDAHLKGPPPGEYRDMLLGLMAEWRSDWGQGNFPFYIVSLHWNGTNLGWPVVREDQLQAYLLGTNTGLAGAFDTPGAGHPPDKEPVGIRLSLWARALVYGEAGLPYSGPIRNPATSYISGNKIVVGFNFTDGGLTTGSVWRPGGAPTPFKVAGADGVYHDATATVVGNTVEVTSASESAPVSVRYIYNYGQGNLYNGAGLPAIPFIMTLTPGSDTQAPTAPTNLAATAVSSSQINLTWTASTDNVGVTGYQIFRGGAQVGTSSTTTYSDTGLSPNTTYGYYVKAYDAAGNISAQSNTAQATTFAAASPSPSPSPTPSQSPTPSPSPTPTLSPSPTPSPSPSPGGTVMHVLDIYTCDAAGVPKTAFVGGNTVYTKVKIVDATNVPVSGASVSVGYVRPNESTPWQTVTGTTGADGIVTVSKALPKNALVGTWTNKVTAVTKAGWTYDSAANVKTQCTYTVS